MSADLSCTFFGTTSIHISDGSTGIFIDAFFSRPSLFRMKFGQIQPDLERIDAVLSRAQITRLDGIFVAHTHFDHVMDAPTVVKKLGGRLYGSASTLNVGRGAGLEEERMQLIAEGEEYALGQFRVRVFEGLHSPGDMFPGTVTAPLRPPVRSTEYKTGKCYSFHIEHPKGSILVHPSANYVPGKFTGLKVNLFYLGIGVLGNQSQDFQEQYLKHTAEEVQFDTIIPIHWDNLSGDLDVPLQPLHWLLDRFAATKQLLHERAELRGWNLQWQEAFEVVRVSADTA